MRPIGDKDQRVEILGGHSAAKEEILGRLTLERSVPEPSRAIESKQQANHPIAEAAFTVVKQDRVRASGANAPGSSMGGKGVFRHWIQHVRTRRKRKENAGLPRDPAIEGRNRRWQELPTA